MNRRRVVLVASSAALTALLLGACATAPQPSASIPEGDFRQRIQTQEADGVRVSAGVPSALESEALFGRPLYELGIQPVWLEIENRRESLLTFLPVGLDPEYFPPLEAASADAADDPESKSSSLIDPFFLEQGMKMLVLPGTTRSGSIFSRLDEGTKSFNVDVAGETTADFLTFTFFLPVPGLQVDHYAVDWDMLYPADQYVELNAEQLIEEIESFACCVTEADGENTGDPLNLVIIGHPEDVYESFIRAGWDETETVTRTSSWKTVKSFLTGGEYRYSPVSSLYVFGRPQDVAFQKARENIHERNHLRLWLSRATHQGLPVWIGQISRDIGVRFTTRTITTHKIDPDVDDSREYLLENLAYAHSLERFGYVGGVGEVAMDQPRGNLTGDPWFTDGWRLVLWLSPRPVPLSAIELLHWRTPPDSQQVKPHEPQP